MEQAATAGRSKRRLTLSRETLRDLEPTHAQMARIRGGNHSTGQATCTTCICFGGMDYSPTRTAIDPDMLRETKPMMKMTIEFDADKVIEWVDAGGPAE
jgi:hypothetical protein